MLPPLLEDFSSTGGLPIVPDTDGNRIPAQRRFKPELVGPDGTNTTFFGQQLPNGDNFPNFSGTSAAAPHVAAVAALMNGQPAIMDFMVTTSAEGPCEGICSFLMASDQTGANVVFDSFFAWNAAADDYDKLEPGDRFNSWQGYWYPLLPEGIGNEARVYIPR